MKLYLKPNGLGVPIFCTGNFLVRPKHGIFIDFFRARPRYSTIRPMLKFKGKHRPTNGNGFEIPKANFRLNSNLLINQRAYSSVGCESDLYNDRHQSEYPESHCRSNETSSFENPWYIQFDSSCWPETIKDIKSSFHVCHDFVNEEEEDILMKELEPHLKRLRYEFDHWDDAIHGYRETERSRWSKASLPIISRMKKFGFPEEKDHIPQIHVLDLAKAGVIKPHVDSVRFCGNIICGLCLLSDAVMRLVHVDNKDQIIDILLPKRALYIMKDESRYNYTHEVLGEKESLFNATPVPRERRISIICRNRPKDEAATQ